MKTIDVNALATASAGYGYGYGWGHQNGGQYWAVRRAMWEAGRAQYWNNQMWPMMAAAAFANQQQPTTVVYY